jgi:hypothetical protein
MNILEIDRVAGLSASARGQQEMYRGKKSKHYENEIRIPCELNNKVLPARLMKTYVEDSSTCS